MPSSAEYGFPPNSLLFGILNQAEGSFVQSPTEHYRLGEIIYELFRYIGINKLYIYRGGPFVVCNPPLEDALGVKGFPADFAVEVLIPKLVRVRVPRMNFGLEEVVKTSELRMIKSVIEQGNNFKE